MSYTFLGENCVLTPGRLGLMTDESLLELGELALAMDRRALTATAGESGEIPDIVEFTRQRLGLDPNPLQASVLRRAARHRQLNAAVGEIDRGGGQGGASRVLPAGQPDPGAVSERPAERRVRAQGGRVREPDGNQGPGRRHKRNLDRFTEPVADCGAAAQGNDVAGIFQSVLDADRRGVAGGREAVSGDASGAGSGERRPVADEHAQWETGILLDGVDGRG